MSIKRKTWLKISAFLSTACSIFLIVIACSQVVSSKYNHSSSQSNLMSISISGSPTYFSTASTDNTNQQYSAIGTTGSTTQQYTAIGSYSDNSTKDITALVTWTSSNPLVATITSTGLATSISDGDTVITATLQLVTSNPVTLTIDTSVTIVNGLFVVNYVNNTIVKYSPPQLMASSHKKSSSKLKAPGIQSPIITIYNDNNGSLDMPNSAAIDPAGNFWVVNYGNNTLVKYLPSQLNRSGKPNPVVIISDDGHGSLSNPYNITFDASGNLWVANYNNNTIVKFLASQINASGSPTPAVVISDDGHGSLNQPYNPLFDASGNLWVENDASGFSTIVKYSPSQISTSGNPTPVVTISDDGNGLLSYSFIMFDSENNLWAINSGSSTLTKYLPSQLNTSGNPTPAITISDDGHNSLNIPYGAVFDESGNLWVTNSVDNAFVQYSSDQIQTSGSPSPITTITDDGNDSLSHPSGILIH